MKTLEKLYNEIANRPEEWNYYIDKCNKLAIDNAWLNICEANFFIHNYFKSGGKEVFDIDKIGYLGSTHERDIHTISTFILGISLSKILEIELKDDALFTWFLVCLYHDIGYKIEENVSLINKAKTLQQFMRFIGIGQDSKIYKKYQANKLCKNYYKYKILEKGSIDHGIVGGLLLEYKLKENYNNKRSSQKKDDFEVDGLRYSKDLFPIYEKAAETIIRHNMWFASDDDTIEIYKKYYLEDLIGNRNNRISLKDNKFLFLLSIADTIEPLKFFIGIKHEFVLKYIKVGFNEKIIEIAIERNCFNYEKYIEKVSSLNDWLDVSVESNGNKCRIFIET